MHSLTALLRQRSYRRFIGLCLNLKVFPPQCGLKFKELWTVKAPYLIEFLSSYNSLMSFRKKKNNVYNFSSKIKTKTIAGKDKASHY